MIRRLVLIFLLSLLAGCSGFSPISGNKEDLYSKEFLAKIKVIKGQYRRGKTAFALGQLEAMDSTKLNTNERALRENLIGVIHFSQKKYEIAIEHFQAALPDSKGDDQLEAQIYLNISVCQYRLGMNEKALKGLKSLNASALSKKEAKKYYKLLFKIAGDVGDKETQTLALIDYLGDKGKVSDLKSDTYFDSLKSVFFRLDPSDRIDILYDYEKNGNIALGYLAFLEAEKIYYSGEKDRAEEVIDWLTKKFENHPDIQGLVQNFYFRLESIAKIDQLSIGLLLPLSGNRKKFGVRSLNGIDAAIRTINKSLPAEKRYKLFVKNTQGSGALGAHAIRDLVKKKFVSVIIGGLFSGEAKREYLEAKKYGVFFISLSQIYLPKEDKDHLLLEVPGSVESQVNHLFSEKMLSSLGKNAAIFYPKGERGLAYLDEFWRMSQLNNVRITGAISYDRSQYDFREPVKNLLGLKYTVERQEEHDLLKEIHKLEGKSSIRRIQTLKPKVDFDWIFVPAFPKQAKQIIPSFTYFDAFNLNIIGGPSWRSTGLSRESHKSGRLIFIGDNLNESTDFMGRSFEQIYSKKPRLIEFTAMDAIRISHDLLGEKEFESRDEFDVFIRGTERVEGSTGEWSLEDGLWAKKMTTHQIRGGQIRKLFN